MYISIYLPSILIALYPLLIKRKVLHKISMVLIIIICLICALYSLFSKKIINYTRYNLTDAYISLCNYLEKNYILNEWKKIDYEALRNDGLILIKEAEQTGNLNKYYDALNNLIYAFHDGHMGLSFYKKIIIITIN